MPDAKKDVGCCSSHWQRTNCTLVIDANLCLSSIVLHQTCTVCIVKHLSLYSGCLISFALSLFDHKTNTIVCCSWQFQWQRRLISYLPPPWRLCFCQFLFVCLFVCLCISKITQKVMDGSLWNFKRMSGMA